MTDYAKIEALRRRLVTEQRRTIESAAESLTLPPARRLAYIADLDANIMAIEAILQERVSLKQTAAEVGTASGVTLA